MKLRTTTHAGPAAPPKPFTFTPSPHVLDVSVFRNENAMRPRVPARLPFLHALDEKIHLRELSSPALPMRPRGIHDFPPKEARTLGQAVALTVRSWFKRHPLTDLTVITLFHIVGMCVWHVVGRPFQRANPRISASVQLHHSRTPALPHFAQKPLRPSVSPSLRPATPLLSSPVPQPLPPSQPRFRTALGITTVTIIFVLPFAAYTAFATLQGAKVQLTADGERGVAMLSTAAAELQTNDFSGAKRDFDAATATFAAVRAKIGVSGTVFSSVVSALPGRHAVASAPPLVRAAESASRAGSAIASSLQSASAADSPLGKLLALRAGLDEALPWLRRARQDIARVSPGALPAEYADAVTSAQARLPEVTDAITAATDSFDALLTAIGADGSRRYLVVFQNDAELRPTGGFIGSFALVDVDKGNVKNVEIPGGGSYDLKGSLKLALESPRPLHLINPHWQFQDANWSPDFPTSAQLLSRFYEKSGGPTVDGVIAINQKVMAPLIAAVGPIEMPEYGKTITAENFYQETQKAVEVEYDRKKNKPKQFISDLGPRLLGKVLAADDKTLFATLAAVRQSLSTKDIQLYFRDAEVQRKTAEAGWDGSLAKSDGDYLAIVHANIAGQKTDLAMRDEVNHDAKILPDGSSIVTLTIRRTHTGKKGDRFSGVRNVDYVRVYVPNGSSFVEADGFTAPNPKLFKLSDPADGADPALAAEEAASRTDVASGTRISTESGKTVFGNWLQTDPGQTTTATIVYRTPADTARVDSPPQTSFGRLFDRFVGERATRIGYSLLVQRQSGAPASTFTSRIDLPRGARAVWQSPERTADDRGRLAASSTLDRDASFNAIIELH